MKWIDLIGGPTVLALVGGILVLVASAWAAYQQNESSKKLEEKNAEIVRLNEFIRGAITGGDSFCYIAVSGDPSPVGGLQVTLVHSGKYPIYDLAVQAINLDEPKTNQASSLGSIFRAGRSVDLENLPPSMARPLGLLAPPSGVEYLRFNIFFSARNGFFDQRLRLRRLPDGRWANATSVSRYASSEDWAKGTNNPVVLERIDPAYPRLPDGTVDWK